MKTKEIKSIYHIMLVILMSFAISSCIEDGEPGPAGPDGIDGSQGEQGDKGDKGDNGNANVTLYKFDGHDFITTSFIALSLDIDVEDLEKSSWDVYLKSEFESEVYYFHIPGLGAFGRSDYSSGHQVVMNQPEIFVNRRTGPGEVYSEIHVIGTEVSKVVDNTTGRSSASVVDMSDYKAVVEYYDLD
jgi:hypothetical protein